MRHGGRRKAGFVGLPRHVHATESKGRTYYYWHPGRGTKNASKPERLPDDPTSPEFWQAIRRHQDASYGPRELTFGDVLTEYEASEKFRKHAETTKQQYRIQLRTIRDLFGSREPESVRPTDVRQAMEAMTPGRGNSFLGVIRAVSTWAISHGPEGGGSFLHQRLTEGIEYNAALGGHKPWTPAQIEAAHKKLTGMVRRGIILGLYTGQRGSDLVRMGWADVDEGGFSLKQRKTGRDIWCPILSELAKEMATWEKAPGPFLKLTERGKGKPYTRKRFWLHFIKQAEKIPELAGVTVHGLRATAVIRLRQDGLSAQQIGDIIGMSPPMIERYCRFADRKASGKAAVIKMRDARK